MLHTGKYAFPFSSDCRLSFQIKICSSGGDCTVLQHRLEACNGSLDERKTRKEQKKRHHLLIVYSRSPRLVVQSVSIFNDLCSVEALHPPPPRQRANICARPPVNHFYDEALKSFLSIRVTTGGGGSDGCKVAREFSLPDRSQGDDMFFT